MTLEEKLRAYAAKGELVHLSLAFTRGVFECGFVAASPASGFALGESSDPVEAIERAFNATPIRPPRVTRHREVEPPVTGELNSEWTSP